MTVNDSEHDVTVTSPRGVGGLVGARLRSSDRLPLVVVSNLFSAAASRRREMGGFGIDDGGFENMRTKCRECGLTADRIFTIWRNWLLSPDVKLQIVDLP